MKWQKINIKTEEGNIVEAQAPLIISASRATDIPAFYSDWFISRLKKTYLNWQNPYNRKSIFVSFKNTKLIVFWSKNPEPILKHIDWLNENYPNYYFQFTLNDYDKTLELNVPSKEKRIETFIKLSEKIGKEKVIWRYDPLIITEKIGTDELLQKIEIIGNSLKNFTEKLIISFADIDSYKKVRINMQKANIKHIEFTENSVIQIARGLQQLNKNWNLQIATCAEEIDLELYKISHNKCIDDDLIKRLFSNEQKLMEFIGYKIIRPDLYNNSERMEKTKNVNLKDKGQRKLCGCIASKDIGHYNTCAHLCTYCYANVSKEIVLKNYNSHINNILRESIIH